MTNYSSKTPAQLEKDLQRLHETQNALDPALAAEIHLVESILHAQEAGRKKTYADIRTVREALELCLNLRGDWKLTKFEVMEDIIDGGFRATKPKATRGILRDSINQRIAKNIYSEKNGLLGRNITPPKKKT